MRSPGTASERSSSLLAAVGLDELADNGVSTVVSLECVRTHRSPGKAGTYRWHDDYRLVPGLGTGIITVSLHGNDDDRRKRFNRTEDVRAIPPGDPDACALIHRRGPASSCRRTMRGRTPSTLTAGSAGDSARGFLPRFRPVPRL